MKFAIYPNGKVWCWDDMEVDGRFPGMASDDYVGIWITEESDFDKLKLWFPAEMIPGIIADINEWMN